MNLKEPTQAEVKAGEAELLGVRKRSRGLYWFVAIFSSFVNALMLTGPLYMLNVYGSVLGSRSFETLVALSVLVAFMYLMMGILDYARGRIMGRIGAQFQTDLDERVFNASMRAKASGRAPAEAATGLRDLQAVQQSITSPVAMAKFDLPWTAVFLLGIFIFHAYLGYLAIAGGVLLVAIAIINQISTKRPLEQANAATLHAENMGEQLRSNADTIQALGMRASAFQRWKDLRNGSLQAGIKAGDFAGSFGSLTKSLRLFLQSAMLGMGAYLVLQDQLTPGAMIAGSILLGRALAPVEMLVNQWPVLNRGRSGWRNLARLLGSVPVVQRRTELPTPKALIVADQVTILPPGEAKASLRMVSFKVNPGEAVGVIGPSGAGKSTLARALAGLWTPAGGTIRLDGASLDQYEPDVLGTYIGYLPQTVTLLNGTIRDNIARMSTTPDDAAVIKAAKRAAAHEMILELPEGYDTIVDSTGGRLSGGQVQRVGLARAMYGDPVYLVLDEPNSNLDNAGSIAINNAIRLMRQEGRCVFVMAHRPAAIEQCDKLMYIDGGLLKAFGPTEEVKAQILANRAQIDQGKGKGGGVA
ncbi:ATP-binding cassette, subfamily C [Octadecabacter temperatus]|uniref:Type I secretion system ATP-binding protein PrsD n=1 Tax=Octadecabacter temperatus TaxID=1458307 RepID=A0A0K0Y4H9_9RHOB|nr:type I secretion system permease/ATPase [Octadecabacter temperatus]AKS45757.1 Type I secretion system ATP-binding protein PrsD [Octadecabacter temperatus]SIN99839.1 ATP-binding cassette, subfamily C [Octadecabacter temperatus]